MVPKLLPYIYSFVPCICGILASIEVVMMKASSIHGWMHAIKTTSLCRAASTHSLSTFDYVIHVSLYVIVCTVPYISSYFCYISRTFVSKCYMFGSSYKVVRTSNDSSNNLVQSFTALLISTIPIVMALVRCFLTSNGVEGYVFNCNSSI